MSPWPLTQAMLHWAKDEEDEELLAEEYESHSAVSFSIRERWWSKDARVVADASAQVAVPAEILCTFP